VAPVTQKTLQTIILEMKFMKKGSSNYSRLITDFVKLPFRLPNLIGGG
jgi:hypothetical protein